MEAALADAFAGEWARVVAALIRTTGDWDVAEDAASAAFERAALTWPRDGVPQNPGAWLTTAARNLALDRLRRRSVERDKTREWLVDEELAGRTAGPADPAEIAAARSSDPLGVDDRLRLVFTCAHPALAMEARVALTLRTVAGLTTAEIARAFLVPEATMAQHLVRAKRKIQGAGIPYRVPDAAALPDRLDGVLAVLWLVHNEGYLASSGEELLRVDLTAEAIRLTALVVDLLPAAAEARALLALMLLQRARTATRVDAAGDLVPLEEQDRSRWDAAAIAEGLAILDAVEPPGDALSVRGPYRVLAEIQALHASAPRAEATDWRAVRARYDELQELAPSPFVDLNRAIAIGMADGPDSALAEFDRLETTGSLAGYHLLPAAQADFLRRAGRHADATARYREAIDLAPTEPERRYLTRRLAETDDAVRAGDGRSPTR